MSELIRPSPPLTWRDRVGRMVTAVQPGRVLATAGALLVVAAGGWWLLRSPAAPVETRLPMAAAATSASSTNAPSSPSAAGVPPFPADGGQVVVQAAGAVAHPGVYRLPAGARVADLVAAAGGASAGADPDALALAARLVDGQRVYVPKVGEIPAAAGAGTDPSGSAPGLVTGPTAPPPPLDLNAATVEQLDELPGIGPTMAAAIVSHRERNGPFRSVEGLLEVRGIGPARLDELRPLVRV